MARPQVQQNNQRRRYGPAPAVERRRFPRPAQARGASRRKPSSGERAAGMLLSCGRASRRIAAAPATRSALSHAGIFGFWLLLFGGGYLGLKAADRPVEGVVMEAATRFTTQTLVEERLNIDMGISFYLFDLDDARAKLMALPWVRRASVGRGWSGDLVVDIDEYEPAFVWSQRSAASKVIDVASDSGDSPAAFISKEGKLVEIFGTSADLDSVPGQKAVATVRSAIAALPVFVWTGDSRASEKLSESFTDTFQRIQAQLEQAQTGLNVASLKRSAAGSWSVNVRGQADADSVDFVLRLGANDTDERLQRFVTIYSRGLYRDVNRIAYADLRYTSGLAIGWQHDPSIESGIKE